MAAPQNETATVLPDGVHILENDATHFEISNIELEEIPQDRLGDTQDARQDHGIADITIGRTILDGFFKEIHYGSYNGRPACRILMTLTVKSDSDFRLSKADLTCTVSSTSTSQLSVSSSDVVRPGILKIVPLKLDDEHPVSTGVTATLVLSPSVSVPNGPAVSIGNFTYQRIYTRTSGWHLHSATRSSDPHHRTSRDTGTWTFSSNEMQKESQIHSFEIEALVRHDGSPFYVDFTLEAKLMFGALMRSIGKRKRIRTRRNFAPHESPMVFS